MSDEQLPFERVPGVRLAAVAAGIRYQNRADLCLLELAPGTRCAAVFTRNAFCAAPVTLARRHLAATPPRYLLINSGNANAGTGPRGLADAEASCAASSGDSCEAETPNNTCESTSSLGRAGLEERVTTGLAAVPVTRTTAVSDGSARVAVRSSRTASALEAR